MVKMAKELKRGDKVTTGFYAGDWQRGTRVVDRVDAAKAEGYVVVSFSDKLRTSAHGRTQIIVED